MRNNIEVSPNGRSLIFQQGYTSEDVKSLLSEYRLDGLKINTRWMGVDNLDFLSDYDFLRSLDIVGIGDFNFDFLSSLIDLRELSISIAGKSVIDFSRQVELEDLSLQWRKGKIIGFENCSSLKSLCLVEYDCEDFSPISMLTGLKDLTVKTSSIRTCKGVEGLRALNSLLLGNCRRLRSIEGLSNLEVMSSLCFNSCPRIVNFDQLRGMESLQRLSIIDCKTVDSMKFVEELPNLEELSILGSSYIEDGDLLPAKRIRDVRIRHRKHYNIEVENELYDEIIKANQRKIAELFFDKLNGNQNDSPT